MRHPKEIAKQALQILSESNKPPTPENYCAAYYLALQEKAKLLISEETILNLVKTLNNLNINITVDDLLSENSLSSIDKIKNSFIEVDQSLEKQYLNTELIQLFLKNLHDTNSSSQIKQKVKLLISEHESLDSNNEEKFKQNIINLFNDINKDLKVSEDDTKIISILIDNLEKFAFEESIIKSQIEKLKKVLADKVPQKTSRVEALLKDIASKQSSIKNDFISSQATLQNMLAKFMESLSQFSEETSDYQEVIGKSSKEIAKASKIEDINKTLSLVLQETNSMYEKSKNKQEELTTIKHDADEAQKEILRLRNELEKSNELIRIDPLTKILNRKGMEEAIEKTMALITRKKNSSCIGILDIDNFKKINDTYGHHIGDEVLIHLANVIKQTLRPNDVIARMGGEEFVVILNETNLEQSFNVVSRIQRELAKTPFESNEHKLNITFSAGLSELFPDSNPQEVLIKADDAMYIAKKTGKNKVIIQK